MNTLFVLQRFLYVELVISTAAQRKTAARSEHCRRLGYSSLMLQSIEESMIMTYRRQLPISDYYLILCSDETSELDLI